MLRLPPGDKVIFSHVVLMEGSEVDMAMFWAGLFSEEIRLERIRIGQRIKQLREEAGITQQELGDGIGVQKPNISRIEAGKYNTGQDLLSKIAKFFGKSLDII